jgi:hypothetical protein
LDVVRVNQVEGELDAYIARADKQRRQDEGERPAEEIWAESVRTYNAKRREALAWEWLRYHVARQRAHRHTFALLNAHHSAEIEKYEAILGLDDPEPDGKDAA